MLRLMGRGDDVHMSSKEHKSRGKRYYATESPKTLKLLDEYRERTLLCVRQ